MIPSQTSTTRIWLWLAVALTLIKLWLTRAQPIFAIGNATLDDRLFLELAQNLVRGEWLGPYNQSTLAKGPAYPMFIALVFYLGIPLGLAQQALYAGACALFARAFRPVFSTGTRVIVYLFLLWNPMSYEAPTLGRVMRQHLATPLGIVIFAGLVALYLRRSNSFRRQWRWAALLGLSIGVFWLTREESIWILPSILLLAGVTLFGAWRTSGKAFRTMLWVGIVSLIGAILPANLVSWQNYRDYGWFGTVEIKASEFKTAYGALQRVKLGPDLAQLPVSRESRAAIYPLSPAFKSLQPWLERDAWTHEGPPTMGQEIRGGWFMWALRESVELSGQAPTAKAALAFYHRLGEEVNAACDAGLLPARSRNDTLIPPLRDGQIAEITRTFLWFGDFVTSFGSFNAYPKLSIGDREELKLFHDLTGDELASSVRAPTIERPNQEALRAFKFYSLQQIGARLCSALYVLCFVIHVVAIIRVFQQLRARTLTYPLVLAAAAWGGIASFLFINALVHVLSFPLTAVSTFSPVYPLLLIFYFAVIWDAITAWFRVDGLNPGQISI